MAKSQGPRRVESDEARERIECSHEMVAAEPKDYDHWVAENAFVGVRDELLRRARKLAAQIAEDEAIKHANKNKRSQARHALSPEGKGEQPDLFVVNTLAVQCVRLEQLLHRQDGVGWKPPRPPESYPALLPKKLSTPRSARASLPLQLDIPFKDPRPWINYSDEDKQPQRPPRACKRDNPRTPRPEGEKTGFIPLAEGFYYHPAGGTLHTLRNGEFLEVCTFYPTVMSTERLHMDSSTIEHLGLALVSVVQAVGRFHGLKDKKLKGLLEPMWNQVALATRKILNSDRRRKLIRNSIAPTLDASLADLCPHLSSPQRALVALRIAQLAGVEEEGALGSEAERMRGRRRSGYRSLGRKYPAIG